MWSRVALTRHLWRHQLTSGIVEAYLLTLCFAQTHGQGWSRPQVSSKGPWDHQEGIGTSRRRCNAWKTSVVPLVAAWCCLHGRGRGDRTPTPRPQGVTRKNSGIPFQPRLFVQTVPPIPNALNAQAQAVGRAPCWAQRKRSAPFAHDYWGLG